MRLIVGIEDRDREVIAIHDFDRTDDEDVLSGKKLVSAFVAARDFVEDTMRDKPVQDFAKSREGGQRLSAVASRVDDLHGTAQPCTSLEEGPAAGRRPGRAGALRAAKNTLSRAFSPRYGHT